MTFDDETLMAFADDALPSDTADAVRAALAQDPALAERVERFRLVRALIAGAVIEAAPPAPAGLMDAARRGAGLGAADRARWPLRVPLALAAGVAGLAIGLGSASLLPSSNIVDLEAGMIARGGLDEALDSVASGQSGKAGGYRVTPLYTVVAAGGRPCRAFRAQGEESSWEGAACFEGGAWRLAAMAPAARRTTGFKTAAGDEPAVVAAALDGLDPGDPLDVADERALIAAGWE